MLQAIHTYAPGYSYVCPRLFMPQATHTVMALAACNEKAIQVSCRTAEKRAVERCKQAISQPMNQPSHPGYGIPKETQTWISLRIPKC